MRYTTYSTYGIPMEAEADERGSLYYPLADDFVLGFQHKTEGKRTIGYPHNYRQIPRKA